jgi:hypothetical protein
LVSPFNSSEGLDPNELEPPLGLLGTVIPAEICGSLLAFDCVAEEIGEGHQKMRNERGILEVA